MPIKCNHAKSYHYLNRIFFNISLTIAGKCMRGALNSIMVLSGGFLTQIVFIVKLKINWRLIKHTTFQLHRNTINTVIQLRDDFFKTGLMKTLALILVALSVNNFKADHAITSNLILLYLLPPIKFPLRDSSRFRRWLSSRFATKWFADTPQAICPYTSTLNRL